MKKETFLFLLLAFTKMGISQFYNINPDPNGPEWIVYSGDYFDSQEIHDYFNSVPYLKLSQASIAKELPYKVDNSDYKYFREIFYQGNEYVCGSASSVGYIFTYEINRLRDFSAADSSNLYSHYYPVNFHTQYDKDSSFLKGMYSNWYFIKKNGIPNLVEFGGIMVDTASRHWLNGYDLYFDAMKNRTINEWKTYTLNEDSLNILKHWLSDHATGDTTGGLAKITVDIYCYNYMKKLKYPSQDTGKYIIIQFGTAGGIHAMSIVGYNDSIM